MAVSGGRRLGVLIIVQMAAALILSFVLMDAVRAGYPSFLDTAAASSAAVRSGVVVATFGAALTVWLALAIFPRFAEHSRRFAMAFAAICVVSAALDMVHNASILSMLSAGEQYAAEG